MRNPALLWTMRGAALFLAVAAGIFWYFQPSRSAPSALAGRSWGADCTKGVQVQWGDGYQIISLDGRQTAVDKVTFSPAIDGFWINGFPGSSHYEVANGKVRATQTVVEGIPIDASGKWLQPCEAPLLTPSGLLESTTQANRLAGGLYMAIASNDPIVVRQFLDRLGDISKLPNIDQIDGLASVSSAEIYTMVQRARGKEVSGHPEDAFANAL